jgi:hypothetical protein
VLRVDWMAVCLEHAPPLLTNSSKPSTVRQLLFLLAKWSEKSAMKILRKADMHCQQSVLMTRAFFFICI